MSLSAILTGLTRLPTAPPYEPHKSMRRLRSTRASSLEDEHGDSGTNSVKAPSSVVPKGHSLNKGQSKVCVQQFTGEESEAKKSWRENLRTASVNRSLSGLFIGSRAPLRNLVGLRTEDMISFYSDFLPCFLSGMKSLITPKEEATTYFGKQSWKKWMGYLHSIVLIFLFVSALTKLKQYYIEGSTSQCSNLCSFYSAHSTRRYSLIY